LRKRLGEQLLHELTYWKTLSELQRRSVTNSKSQSEDRHRDGRTTRAQHPRRSANALISSH
jgi:hypothetical protein